MMNIYQVFVQMEIFKKIKIFDYQAICLETAQDGSAADILLTPFKLIFWMFNWILSQVAYTLIRMEVIYTSRITHT